MTDLRSRLSLTGWQKNNAHSSDRAVGVFLWRVFGSCFVSAQCLGASDHLLADGGKEFFLPSGDLHLSHPQGSGDIRLSHIFKIPQKEQAAVIGIKA